MKRTEGELQRIITEAKRELWDIQLQQRRKEGREYIGKFFKYQIGGFFITLFPAIAMGFCGDTISERILTSRL